jgi:dihydroneopterin triphosphate diphosphatase
MTDTVLESLKKHSFPIVCNAGFALVPRRHNEQVELFFKRCATLRQWKWCQVEGSIELDEITWHAAPREVREEAGFVLSELRSGDTCEAFYEPKKTHCDVANSIGFVEPHSDVQLQSEYDAFDRLDFDTACERLVFPVHRHTLSHIEAEFVRRFSDSLLRRQIN